MNGRGNLRGGLSVFCQRHRRRWVGACLVFLGCSPQSDSVDWRAARQYLPRFSGNAYAECSGAAPVLRPGSSVECLGPGTSIELSKVEIGSVVRELRPVDAETDPDGAHGRGRWHLLWPDREASLDRAIASLELAQGLAPDRAPILSDLAAAHLVRAARQENPLDLLRALELSAEAVALDPALPEARFNRALAREALSLQEPASRDWRALLELGEPGWELEASDGLTRTAPVDRPSVAEFDQTVRRAIADRDDELLRSLSAGAADRVRFEIASHLPAWAACGSAAEQFEPLASAVGDRVLEAGLQQLADGCHPQAAGALSELAEGLARLRNRELESARRSLSAAQDSLTGIGSPFAWWASEALALCAYHAASFDSSLERYAALLSAPATREFSALRARAARQVGVIHSVEGRYGEALAALEPSLENDESGSIPLSLRLNTACAAADTFLRLGRADEALGRLSPLLPELDRIPAPESHYLVSYLLTRTALVAGQERAALQLQEKALRLAVASGRPATVASAYRERAILHRAVGEAARASVDLERAREAIAEIPTGEGRRVAAALLDQADAIVHEGLDDAVAVDAIDRALETFAEVGYRYRAASAYRTRGSLLRRAGRLDASEASFEQGLRSLEEERRLIGPDRLRADFFSQASALFEDKAALQLERGERVAALATLERLRGQLVLDWRSGRGRPAVVDGELTAALERLPERTALVIFALIGEQSVVWVARDSALTFRSLSIEPASLQRQAAQWRAALLEDSPAATELGRSLARALFAPLADLLAGTDSLVLVPDPRLASLPLAALPAWDGKGLILDRYELATTPSLTFFTRTGGRALTLRPGALVLGNPSPPPALSLPSLPGAEREARSVARLLGAEPRLGSEATATTFFEQASRSFVVHLASHSLTNSRQPLWSSLVLAPDEESEGLVYGHEIPRLPETGLVVLSSCESASGLTSPADGPLSLAKIFLGRGAEAVVASLWAVEDRGTADLLDGFYTALITGSDPAAALRRAQRDARARGEPASIWASFQVLRSGARWENHQTVRPTD